ncbi:MAG TPA: proprotein convertase P-domain-containing protein [Anaerolineae bacterium]|nr:proprotein convertase P-domain-containing protein [Anaerolineae bacterium]
MLQQKRLIVLFLAGVLPFMMGVLLLSGGQVVAGEPVAESGVGLSSGVGGTLVYTSTDGPLAITDMTAVTSTINILDGDMIGDVDVILNLTHSWNEDLEIKIVGPTGAEVLLSQYNGGDGDDYTGTIFDDEASCAITDTGCAAPPFTGRFRPEGSLDLFDGETVAGSWQLVVYDGGVGSTGSLVEWQLVVEPAGGSQIQLVQTVGGMGDGCDGGDSVMVAEGADVYFCYTVHNLGSTTLTLHDLEDSYLGMLLDGHSLSLASGEMAVVTATAALTTSMTNVGMWTAYNAGPTDVATDDDSTTVTVVPPSIALEVTVGLDKSVCAETDTVGVASGTAVTFCYRVTNTSLTTFYLHDLIDNEGTIFTDFEQVLAPEAATFVTKTVVVTTDIANVAQWTAYNPGPTDVVMGQDMAQVYLVTPAIFGSCEGFEGGILPGSMYAVVSENGSSTGRVDVTFNYPFTGNFALNLDTDCTNCTLATTQAAVLTVDMDNVTSAELFFAVWNHGDEADAADGVYLSDDGSNFERIYSFNGLPNEYITVTLDLAQAAGNVGVDLGDSLWIKFQGYDDGALPQDGYSFDDICVRDSVPRLGVAPPALLSLQNVDQYRYRDVVVENEGTGTLEWTVVEAPVSCDAPGDVPWLSWSPNGGELASGESATMEVVFDSTGMGAGSYTGWLCLQSNDPVSPTVPVSTLMVVDTSLPEDPTLGLAKTVSTDGSCGTGSTLTTEWSLGLEVTYCYEVSNTGGVTATLHTLVDEEWGTLLSDLEYVLAPGASYQHLETVSVAEPDGEVTTVACAYWEGESEEGGIGRSAEACTTVTVTGGEVDSAVYLPMVIKP